MVLPQASVRVELLPVHTSARVCYPEYLLLNCNYCVFPLASVCLLQVKVLEGGVCRYRPDVPSARAAAVYGLPVHARAVTTLYYACVHVLHAHVHSPSVNQGAGADASCALLR